MRPFVLATALALAALPAAVAAAADPDPRDWKAVLDAANGQTVYWNAWGGSTATNDFIDWVGRRVAEENGVTLEHVKLGDTAEAVSRILAEKVAGRDTGGAVDLVWINGENFAALREAGLLYGPFATDLPNWHYVDDTDTRVTHDFTVPTEGYEAPWATAQVVLMHDTADLPEAPRDMGSLLDWAEANPGRFTFPQPPDFLGTTFLKQALVDLAPDPTALQAPVEEADYAAVTAPLWDFLDRLTPNLWRQGRAYPQSGPRQLQLLADDEIDLAFSFSPGEASAAIADGRLPDTVRTAVLDGGTIGNASFVAIPYNANAKAGAMVVANFLLSPEAQARALDPGLLGYGTVLDMARLDPADRAGFDALELGVATLPPKRWGTRWRSCIRRGASGSRPTGSSAMA